MSSADQRNRMKAATDKYVLACLPLCGSVGCGDLTAFSSFRMKGTTDRIANAQRTVAETEEIGTWSSQARPSLCCGFG